MYLSKISIKNFRVFSDAVEVLRIPEEVFRKSFYLRRILKFDGGTESRVLVLVGRRL